MDKHGPAVELRIQWRTDEDKITRYAVWALTEDDQLRWVADFEQGPFDTALDVAQWAWRAIAREVQPSTC